MKNLLEWPFWKHGIGPNNTKISSIWRFPTVKMISEKGQFNFSLNESKKIIKETKHVYCIQNDGCDDINKDIFICTNCFVWDFLYLSS